MLHVLADSHPRPRREIAYLAGETPPTNVVPEPASMTLMATGLASLSAARRRKRSRQVA